MFLNCTHHPSASWSQAQQDAARALSSSGIIEDLVFPDVPPELEDISPILVPLIASIRAKSPAAVLIQGEATLAFAAVVALERGGIPCYAATTRRIVIEVAPNVVQHDFQFVRMRRYYLGLNIAIREK